MPNITISGQSFFVYADQEDASSYLIPSPSFSAWSALNADEQGRLLIQATRLLDQLPWKEACGLTQEERALRTNIVNASIEIAAILASGDTAILGGSVGDEAILSLKAGSAEITYQKTSFLYVRNPNSLLSKFPPYILNMIKGCIASFNSSGIGGAISYGTHYPSSANDPWDYSK